MFNFNKDLNKIREINGVRDSLIPFLISSLSQNQNIFYVAQNDLELSNVYNFLYSNFKEINIYKIPAWDCLPYDISSPNLNLIGERVKSYTDLCFFKKNKNENKSKNVILTTINGLFNKTAPKDFFLKHFINLNLSSDYKFQLIIEFLNNSGYKRVQTVREFGEFSIRGSILDVFPVGNQSAYRIDFIGENIETIKTMDPLTQRSKDKINDFNIYTSNEFILNEKNIENFRKRFRSKNGAASINSLFYENISSGMKFNGIEHFLPLFHEKQLNSIFDYLPLEQGIICLLTKNFENLIQERELEINNFGNERKDENTDYNAFEIEELYITKNNILDNIKKLNVIQLNEYDKLDNTNQNEINLSSKPLIIPNFINSENINKINNFLQFCINEFNNNNKIITIITEDETKINNLVSFFEEDLNKNKIIFELIEIKKLVNSENLSNFNFSYSPYLESFELNNHIIIFTRDIFGFPENKRKSWRRKTENFLKDVNSINVGDLVAHIDHGIGLYDGLLKISTNGIDHDCLKLLYQDGDKLFLPVENMNLLSRVGDSGIIRNLDKLGASNWQNRKANVKKRIKDMAEKLIRVAAQREIINTEKLSITDDYDKFSNDFPFQLTDDQDSAIKDVISDLEAGKLMDRLICGDVGFGKTEVALRASFIVANAGYQVALVAPTTILVKQHYKSFYERFKNSSLKVSSLSRMTIASKRKIIKNNLKSGEINIVVGTHALLSNDIDFNNLGLLIVDEEQHFGVAQKEKIKELQGNIHVLTLTATPIPRTLQLSLSGLKQLSLISTPPVDRLSIRTFVFEWDKVVLLDALNREKNRGGQSFIVCPRIKDIDGLYEKVKKMAPNLSIKVAHGQMKIDELDSSINSFADGKSDVLISTNIIESGIDIPNANTMIIYKSDMFGLSQLYQLRGRIGRGKKRAYAYFTVEAGKVLNKNSQQRLDVIKTLDNLGAGFSLASYDMDIRGAGNLLGDEQSGQIKEVGVELYQDMLKDAVYSYKNKEIPLEEVWSPSISLGLAVLIPDTYVYDLSTRMALYRKAGDLRSSDEINEFNEELFDRFGPPPVEVNNLLQTLIIKNKCLKNNISFIDAGPKGILLGFKNNFFKNTDKLLDWISKSSGQIKVRPDQKLFMEKQLKSREEKIENVIGFIDELENLKT